MLTPYCISKLHRLTVIETDLNYVGSLTLDANLVNAAGVFEGQQVLITNVTRPCPQWTTYIMKGEAGTGMVCLNGPPAHFFEKGDIIIVLAYGFLNGDKCTDAPPRVVYVDEKNQITSVKKENVADNKPT